MCRFWKISINELCLFSGQPLEKSMTYAKFPISSLYSYTFTIYSVNEAGRSEDNSFVYVSKFESEQK